MKLVDFKNSVFNSPIVAFYELKAANTPVEKVEISREDYNAGIYDNYDVLEVSAAARAFNKQESLDLEIKAGFIFVIKNPDLDLTASESTDDAVADAESVDIVTE